jgi:hypothetical protein
LDVVKTGFINTPKFSFFARNYRVLLERLDISSVESVFSESEAESHELWEKYSEEVTKEEGSKPVVEAVCKKRVEE